MHVVNVMDTISGTVILEISPDRRLKGSRGMRERRGRNHDCFIEINILNIRVVVYNFARHTVFTRLRLAAVASTSPTLSSQRPPVIRTDIAGSRTTLIGEHPK